LLNLRERPDGGEDILDAVVRSLTAPRYVPTNLAHAMMFIRFVVGCAGDDHRALTGIFTEARILRDDGAFVPHELAQLEETFDWFNRELPCPPFASERWPREAASWFKDGAQTAIARMWTIVHLLEEHDVPTRVLRSKSPGKVLYEDDWQVVVLEWKHL